MAAIMGLALTMNSSAAIKSLDSINGADFAAIRDSLPTFKGHDLRLEKCAISLISGESETVIVYLDKKARESDQKPIGVRLQPEAELSVEETRRILSQFKPRAHLQGSSLAPILEAARVFESRGFDLSPYKIELIREKMSYTVIFVDKDGEGGGLGAPGSRPGFEVELDTRDLRVIRSNFIR